MKPSTALAGPGVIPIPSFVHADAEIGPDHPGQLDFESELAVVMLKDAKDVSVEDAPAYIAGSVYMSIH